MCIALHALEARARQFIYLTSLTSHSLGLDLNASKSLSWLLSHQMLMSLPQQNDKQAQVFDVKRPQRGRQAGA